MSVVDLIRLREVREVLDPLVHVTRPRRTFNVPVVIQSSNPRNASLVGTAFDYGLRFLLHRQNPSAQAGTWIAEQAAAGLERYAARLRERYAGRLQKNDPRLRFLIRPTEHVARRAKFRTQNARVFLRKHLKRRAVDQHWLERLAVHALKLARLDPYYRSGYFDEQLVATDDSATVAEVVAMLQAAPVESLSDASLWLNPDFGRHSIAVGGADADLIAGDRLIELKARKNACVERDHMCQLIVYSMLVDLARKDGIPFPEINTIQVYFARHVQLVSFDLRPARGLSRYKAASDFIIEVARGRYSRKEAMTDG